jgi:hypothetical protein
MMVVPGHRHTEWQPRPLLRNMSTPVRAQHPEPLEESPPKVLKRLKCKTTVPDHLRPAVVDSEHGGISHPPQDVVVDGKPPSVHVDMFAVSVNVTTNLWVDDA